MEENNQNLKEGSGQQSGDYRSTQEQIQSVDYPQADEQTKSGDMQPVYRQEYDNGSRQSDTPGSTREQPYGWQQNGSGYQQIYSGGSYQQGYDQNQDSCQQGYNQSQDSYQQAYSRDGYQQGYDQNQDSCQQGYNQSQDSYQQAYSRDSYQQGYDQNQDSYQQAYSQDSYQQAYSQSGYQQDHNQNQDNYQQYGQSQNNGYQQNYGNSANGYQQYQPYQKVSGGGASSGFGIASMILGILSLLLFCTCVNIPLAIVSVIFGIIHLGRNTGERALGIVGIITSIISIAALILTVILMWAPFKSFYQQEILNRPHSSEYDDWYDDGFDYDLDDFFNMPFWNDSGYGGNGKGYY